MKDSDRADIFALAANTGQDLIVDFEDGVDLIQINPSLSFGQLNIIDIPVYSTTIIQHEESNEVIAVLQ